MLYQTFYNISTCIFIAHIMKPKYEFFFLKHATLEFDFTCNDHEMEKQICQYKSQHVIIQT
jgi:hypothetical protein